MTHEITHYAYAAAVLAFHAACDKTGLPYSNYRLSLSDPRRFVESCRLALSPVEDCPCPNCRLGTAFSRLFLSAFPSPWDRLEGGRWLTSLPEWYANVNLGFSVPFFATPDFLL